MRYVLVFLVFCHFQLSAQDMTAEKLTAIIEQVADTTIVYGNSIHFAKDSTLSICVYDENANRMRIISPIVPAEQLDKEQILNALVANFHTALDVKYALSDELLWSVYLHPLRELKEHQVEDAIQQVHAAARNFGTTYASTDLVFPGTVGNQDSESPKEEKYKLKSID